MHYISKILAIVLFAPLTAFAQNYSLDSLRSATFAAIKDDVATAERLQALFVFYRRTNPDSALLFAEKSHQIGQALNNAQILAKADFLKAAVLLDRNQNGAARALFGSLLRDEARALCICRFHRACRSIAGVRARTVHA